MLEDTAGMNELRRLGARSVPIVSKGDAFVFAQSLQDVADFLEIASGLDAKLTPAQLMEKLDLVLTTAQRLIRQLPDDSLENLLPNRPRTYRVLTHHIFRIPEAFLEVTEGAELTYESLAVAPPETMRQSSQIADFGVEIQARVQAWWEGRADKSCTELVPTYYGEQQLHDVLERSTWHSAQHVRQIAMVLEGLGITPDKPLTAADTKGLPLPEQVWDE